MRREAQSLHYFSSDHDVMQNRVIPLLPIVLAVLVSGCNGLNFREVEPGALYVSGQATPEQFDRLHARYNFRTVVNLRGPHEGSQWYAYERATARRKGIRYVDLDISRRRGPTPDDLARLHAILDDEDRHPVYAHCWAGSDRAGLVAAVYRIRHLGWENERALERMFHHGYGTHLFPRLAEFVRGYPDDVGHEGEKGGMIFD
jgi:protein tyrosine/serine phosphatase